MNEGSYSAVHHSSSYDENFPIRHEHEHHLLSPQEQQRGNGSHKSKSSLPLSRLRNLSYVAMFGTWFGSVVLLGISAQSVAEDELPGAWLNALVYNIVCVRINLVIFFA
jgi:hypothetical protein